MNEATAKRIEEQRRARVDSQREGQASEVPGRARPIVALQLRAPVIVGVNPTHMIDTARANSHTTGGMTFEDDPVSRRIFVRYETPGGVAYGWTPYENVIGVNEGTDGATKLKPGPGTA